MNIPALLIALVASACISVGLTWAFPQDVALMLSIGVGLVLGMVSQA